jgi:DNA-binding NarL/FixJ family response regulator
MDPETPEQKKKVFLLDDHPIVRLALCQLLNSEPDLFVCGEAGSASAALQNIPIVAPDIVVAEISLQEIDGLEFVRQLRSRWAALPVLILSIYDESEYAARALRAGANGYVTKREALSQIVLAIRHILMQGTYVSNAITADIVARFVHSPQVELRSAVPALTARELEVFSLMGKGHSTARVAEDLRISVKTVESHQAHIKEKLSLQDGRSLVRRAIQWVGEMKAG